MKSRIEQSHKQLEALNKRASRDTLVMADERRNLQCQIYKLEQQARDKYAKREHGVGLMALDWRWIRLRNIAKYWGKFQTTSAIVPTPLSLTLGQTVKFGSNSMAQ